MSRKATRGRRDLPVGMSMALSTAGYRGRDGSVLVAPQQFAEIHRLSRHSYRWRLTSHHWDDSGKATTQHEAETAARAAAARVLIPGVK